MEEVSQLEPLSVQKEEKKRGFGGDGEKRFRNYSEGIDNRE